MKMKIVVGLFTLAALTIVSIEGKAVNSRQSEPNLYISINSSSDSC